MPSAERRCVYTALFGGYETLLEQHVAARYDTDLICFTDDPSLASSSWQIRQVTPRFPLDPDRSSRFPKIMAHELLPDYDASIYIDNTVLLTRDPTEIFDDLLPVGVAMASIRHSYRDSVAAEFDAVVAAGVEAPWACAEQREHYEAYNPEALAAQTLWNGLMLRRHNVEDVKATMAVWWEHVLRYSRRDQLSLHAALHTTGLAVRVHELDNFVSPYHEWPRHGHRLQGRPPVLLFGPERRIADLEGQLTAAQADRNALSGELAAAQAELGVLSAELTAAQADRNAVSAELAAAQADRDAVARDLADTRATASWRVTRPLRAIKGALSKTNRPNP
jgi:hypothetical protein